MNLFPAETLIQDRFQEQSVIIKLQNTKFIESKIIMRFPVNVSQYHPKHVIHYHVLANSNHMIVGDEPVKKSFFMCFLVVDQIRGLTQQKLDVIGSFRVLFSCFLSLRSKTLTL